MGRLFWKLFIAFWIAFAVIIIGGFFGINLYRQHLEYEFFENSTRPEVHTVARTLAEEGEQATIRLLKELQRSRRRLHLTVVDDEGQSLQGFQYRGREHRFIRQALQQPLRFPQRKVTTPEGNTYHVISADRRSAEPPERHMQNSPWIILPIAGVVSLLLCFGLARYLSHPIKRLSRASRSYSHGNLDVRVAPAVGSRKDEIADLARDFDTMAEKLKTLIGSQQQLLRDVSHELRSPLARLQMAIGLARKRQSDSGLQNGELDRIEKDVKRLGELIAQILTLSRLETDVADTRNDMVDVAELLATIVEDADFEARTCNSTVTQQTIVQPVIMADGELLRQALENIVRNAVKYTAEDSIVTVLIDDDCREEHFRIRVCDRGPGVAEEMLDSLFEPFVRVSEAREREYGDQGYGLGMAITKRAIELHNGSVIAGNRDGGGLCVSILLPFNGAHNGVGET